MNQPSERECEELDVLKLIAAVRGSRAARVIFHYRSLGHFAAEAFYGLEESPGAIRPVAQGNATAFADDPVVDVRDAQVGIH